MNWINQLFFAVLISSLTGTLMFGILLKVQKLLMKINPGLIYYMMRWVCILYLFPIGYIAMRMGYHRWIQGPTDIWKIVFAPTKAISIGISILAVVWFGTACAIFATRVYTYIKVAGILRGNIDEDDERVLAVYRKTCENMKISAKRMGICRNDMICTPMIVHLIYPKIVLPYGRIYSQDELETIFAHELSHYKHRDLWFKIMCVYITVIHCFNPAAYRLVDYIDRWSECMADASAIKQFHMLEHMRKYFMCVLQLVPSEEDVLSGIYMFSMLGKTKKELEYRIHFMKKYCDVRENGKVTTCILIAVFIIVTSTIAVGAGTGIAEIHSWLYRNTEIQMEQKIIATDDEVEEYSYPMERKKDWIYEQIQEVGEGAFLYDWTLEPGAIHVAEEVYIEANQMIDLSLTVAGKEWKVQIGVIDENGIAYYVNETDILNYTFDVTISGKYRFFIQNKGDTKITCVGACVYGNSNH